MGDDHLKLQSNTALQEAQTNYDRISSLHDPLIHQIFSYLPTQEVARTSILSKRWKSLWTGAPSLDFDDCRFLSYGTPVLDIVERVVMLRDGLSIQRFRLLLSQCIISSTCPRVVSLIAAAASHNIQHLDINLSLYTDSFTLPCSIFYSRSLTVLKLSMDYNLELPIRFSLPSLKVLHLRSLKFPNAMSMENLFSSCPVLEELTLLKWSLINSKGFNITIPSLKQLVMDYYFDDHNESPCYIEVEAPALQFFNYRDKLSGRHLNLSKTSSIENFQLCLLDSETSDYPWVQKLIAAAVTHKLQELVIDLSKYKQSVLPCSVFDCQSLSVLKLSMKCTLELPNHISLPCLKVLHLCSFAFPNADSSIEDLFPCCHALEELVLTDCRWIHQNSVNIVIPSLKSLTIHYNYYNYYDPEEMFYIEVEAPDLRLLNYNGKKTRYLNLLKASSMVKFQLSHYCVVSSGYSHVQSLVAAAAVSPNIQHVDIDVNLDVDYPDDPLTLPCSVFDCQTLCTLKIQMKCTLMLPDHISLPSLKVMYLDSIAFQDAESIEKLFSCCLVLEELTLQMCEYTQLCSITISIPSLKKFTMWGSYKKPNGSSITVDSPSLGFITYRGPLRNNIYLTNLPSSSSSIKACIDTRYRHYVNVGRFVKLLQGLENLVSLTITEDTAVSISSAMAEDKVSEKLPVFHHLKYLDLRFNVKGSILQGMLGFFHFMPNLYSIEFSEGVHHTIRKSGIKWMPTPLPKCFSSSLKILSLGNVVGQNPELSFLESFLEKVVSLERINIFEDRSIHPKRQELLRNEVKRLSKGLKDGASIVHPSE